MRPSIIDRVRAATVQLQAALASAREALAGRRNFGPEELRAAARPVAEMDALAGEAIRLRRDVPELDRELTAYAQTLLHMQEALVSRSASALAMLPAFKSCPNCWNACLNLSVLF